MVAIYAAVVLLFSLPFMQHALANWTANLLTEQLGAKVEIGSANLGFLNRVILNDLTLYEPNGKKMASVARASASIDLLALLSNRIDKTPNNSPNYQFIIDAFKKEEKEEPTPLDLHIGSLIMRHTDVTYDVKSEALQKGTLDPNHLNLHDFGMNMVLRCLTDDSLNVNVRRLQGQERNSGLTIHDSNLKVAANKQYATLSDLSVSMPHSQINLDSLQVTYGEWETNKSFHFHTTTLNGYISPSDLAPLYEKLSTINSQLPTVNFQLSATGNEKEILVKECNISSEHEDLMLHATARITHPLNKQQRNISADISTLRIGSDDMLALADAFAPDHHKESLFNALQERMDFTGQSLDGHWTCHL